MRGGNVEVRDNEGEISLIYKNKELNYKIFNSGQKLSVVATSKEINQRVDQKIKPKPAKDHCWRKTMLVRKARGEMATHV